MRITLSIAMACGVAVLASSATACKQNRMWMANDRPSTGIGGHSIDSNVVGVLPGIHPATAYGELHNPYGNSSAARYEGRRLFVAYNCSGCHGGHAGGGMGPSLRDSVWSYGNSDTQIFATIVEGRPLGMPAWGARIPENQIWQLVAYVKSLRTPQEPDPPSPANPPKSSAGK